MKKLSIKTFIVILLLLAVCISNVYAVEAIKGDTNGDGKLSAVDLSMLKAYIVKLKEYEDTEKFDVNGDTKINITDASILKLKLVGLFVEIDQTEREEIENYLHRYAKFINYFGFSDPTEIDLLLEKYDSLPSHIDEFSSEDSLLLMLLEQYLYGRSENELGVSNEKIEEIANELGYTLSYDNEHSMGTIGCLSTIEKIKANYYTMFGKEMPESIVQDFKNSKDYIAEYDAIFYTRAEGHNTGMWTIGTIIDIAKQGELYNIGLQIGNETTYVTLKKVNGNYHFVSLCEDISEEEKVALEEFFNGTTPGIRRMAQFVLTFEFQDPYEIENVNALLNYLHKPCETELGVSAEKINEITKDFGYEEVISRGNGSAHLVKIEKIKENYRIMFGKEIPNSIIEDLKNSEKYLSEYDAVYWINAFTNTGIFEVRDVDGKKYGHIYKLTLNVSNNVSNPTEVIIKKNENSYSYISINR